MVHQMENNLQLLENNMDNVLKTAEMLGGAHQEARVIYAVELMSVHMEHLKRHHATVSEEMLEVRKLLHRRKGRLHSDSTDDTRPVQTFITTADTSQGQHHLTSNSV
ncbi:lymphoid-restricted membrane protein-like isoform X2 [Sinocyclocheilus grahami]|uniref:lymphoid-restricted membrane protein-like isoform X2 n=1 Tax=Sinocyclocheilus grahami TaxID=75366 RepID=UPI0007AD36EC|nr:PREDICTED: lymphoid-restricted membrane protein-like isoform X2 [Sinocyclocheilus grahami]